MFCEMEDKDFFFRELGILVLFSDDDAQKNKSSFLDTFMFSRHQKSETFEFFAAFVTY